MTHDTSEAVIIDFVKRREQSWLRLLVPFRWVRYALPLGSGDNFIPAGRLLALVGLAIQTVRAAVRSATPVNEMSQRALGYRAVTGLTKLIWSRGKCSVLESVERGLVNRDRPITMDEMANSAIAFHESLEHNFVVTVWAWPETEVILFSAMLQKSVQLRRPNFVHPRSRAKRRDVHSCASCTWSLLRNSRRSAVR